MIRRALISSFVFACSLLLAPSVAHAAIVSASWYGIGDGFHGKRMANGEIFNAYDNTVVAHKTLAFGTTLLVSNPANGRTLCLEVQDRGPYIHGRTLDLSYGAANELGYINRGVAQLNMRITDCEPGASS